MMHVNTKYLTYVLYYTSTVYLTRYSRLNSPYANMASITLFQFMIIMRNARNEGLLTGIVYPLFI